MSPHTGHQSSSPAGKRDTAARRLLRVQAQGPLGEFVAVGKSATALLALDRAGLAGMTALALGTRTLRLANYVHVLRHQFGFVIEIQHEEHTGGWHGCYVLLSSVTLAYG